MKPGLRDLVQFMWSNFDNVVAMAICILAGLYNFGKDPAEPILLTAITWALGLLAFGSIKDRDNRKKLQKHIEAISKSSCVLLNRKEFKKIEDITANAQEICLFGASLVTLLGSQKHRIEELIKTQHTNVKVLILENDMDIIESAALCIDAKRDELVDEIKLSESIVDEIARAVEGLRGTIELRKVRVFPNYGLTIINYSKTNGYMTVEYNGFQEKTFDRPHVELRKKDNLSWFELYEKDFKRLWNSASRCIHS